MNYNNSMEFKTYTYPLIQIICSPVDLAPSLRLLLPVAVSVLGNSFSGSNVRAWPSTVRLAFIFKIILIKSVIKSIKSKAI